MRIAYVTHTRFPTEKAHGGQIASVCHALSELGHTVTLFQPTVWNAITQDPYKYYGLPESFFIRQLRHFDAQKASFIPGSIRFLLNMWFYRNAIRSSEELKHFDMIYVRSFLILPPLLRLAPVVFEVHSLPRFGKKMFAAQCNRCKLVVCLTSPMRDELERWGVEAKRLCVEGDGVDLSRFSSLPLQAKAKSLHHLPEDPVIVGYAGSLVTRDTIQKGVGELVDAIAELRKQKMEVFAWIIGGPPAWVRVYEERAKQNQLSASDIRFEGRIAASEIPAALIACDVLVYPAPASNDPYFVRDTSPLKLFEYMASGVPIVCADLPPIRDIVDETCVKFCKPGDVASLAQGIRIAIQHPETAQERAKEAKRRAEYHSWKERMRRILERLEKCHY